MAKNINMQNRFLKILAFILLAYVAWALHAQDKKVMEQRKENAALTQGRQSSGRHEIREGEGKTAQCGQEVSIHYQGYLPRNILFEDTSQGTKPVTFIIGQGTQFRGLELGIIGMKKGGMREVFVPAKYAYDDPGFSHELVPENTDISLLITLIDLGEKHPDIAKKGCGK